MIWTTEMTWKHQNEGAREKKTVTNKKNYKFCKRLSKNRIFFETVKNCEKYFDLFFFFFHLFGPSNWVCRKSITFLVWWCWWCYGFDIEWFVLLCFASSFFYFFLVTRNNHLMLCDELFKVWHCFRNFCERFLFFCWCLPSFCSSKFD